MGSAWRTPYTTWLRERGGGKGVPIGPEKIAFVVSELGRKLGTTDDAKELGLFGVGGLGVGGIELASGGLLQLKGEKSDRKGGDKSMDDKHKINDEEKKKHSMY